MRTKHCPVMSRCCCALGSSPQYSKGSYIPVFPTEDRQSVWRGRIAETSDNVVTMGITSSPECIVGKYMIYIGVVTPYGIRRTKRDPSTDVYILFNPWSPGLTFLPFWEKLPYVTLDHKTSHKMTQNFRN